MLVKINDSKIKCSVNHDCFKEGEDVTITVGGNIVATASVCHIESSTNFSALGIFVCE